MTDLEMTISGAAKIYRVTRQAIYLLVRAKKIKAHKKNGQWMVTKKDIDEYQMNKYSHQNRVIDGVKIFDNDKGLYSVRQASEITGVPMQKIYYMIRTKVMPAKKNGTAWVVKYNDFIKYKRCTCTNQSK